jgi:glutamyl-tRNA synthetase
MGEEVRVRIAPSPTGDPHVGTAYIALFNYAFARSQHGKFVLRIEDTDRTRSTRESEDAILRALGWLNLRWDEGPDVGGPYGPYRQSERSAIYREHCEILVSRGRAYRCFCTAERLETLRQIQKAEKRPTGYDRKCRTLDRAESDRRGAAGEPFVVRMAMPTDGETVFLDKLHGESRFENRTVDDQVLLKSDGFPTYHLANVVDDHLMKITHVIRAEEWMSSTPKHVVLYDAFGWKAPEWIHMPLLRNEDQSKISKRKNPVSLDYYREIGVLPEALLNFLGTMGWSIGGDREIFDLHEMVEKFDIARVRLGGPVFDLKKLTWMNGKYLHELSDDALLRELRGWRLSDERLRRMLPLFKERMEKLDDLFPQATFLFAGDLDYRGQEKHLQVKGKTPKDVKNALEEALEIIDAQRDFRGSLLEPPFRALAEKLGFKTGELFMLLRVSISGGSASPPLFESMEILGREMTRRRLRKAMEFLPTIKPA